MTIKDILNTAVRESPERTVLRFRQGGSWQGLPYKALQERAWHVAEMLTRLGVKQGDRVALCRENSPEWYEIYYGIMGIAAIAVPVDPKLREAEVAHIIHDSGASVMFCSAKARDIMGALDGRPHELRAVIVLDCKAGDLPSGRRMAFHVYDELWGQVSAAARAEGRAYDQCNPDPESPASLIYTSGTTGRQKGAVLSHRNFMANIEGIARAIDIRRSDNFMLALPLHHSFAFTTMLLLPVYAQCQVSFIENLKTIRENMADTAPTVLLAVPLLLEKLLNRIMEGIENDRLARLMYRFGLAGLVGKKVHAGFGGSLRLIVSGGAPISPATLRAWSRLGFPIVEGYGITETAPVLTFNPPQRPKVGTVGLPIAGVEISITEPDAEGVGEIIARGQNVMQGYYKNPAETAKVLRNGWYYTGDLGYLDADGYLVITGRKKNLIINREGKNIYPEEVEEQVLRSPYVLECLALGYREPADNAGERVGLIVVPSQAAFDAMEDGSGRHMTDQEIEKQVLADVRRHLEAVAEYKRPRRIQIRFEEFEKTTTFKIKRHLYAIDTADS